jgi:hypothetical protein
VFDRASIRKMDGTLGGTRQLTQPRSQHEHQNVTTSALVPTCPQTCLVCGATPVPELFAVIVRQKTAIHFGVLLGIAFAVVEMQLVLEPAECMRNQSNLFNIRRNHRN